jgi:hypothetical protein
MNYILTLQTLEYKEITIKYNQILFFIFMVLMHLVQNFNFQPLNIEIEGRTCNPENGDQHSCRQN